MQVSRATLTFLAAVAFIWSAAVTAFGAVGDYGGYSYDGVH